MTFFVMKSIISSPRVSVDSGIDRVNSARALRWVTSNLFLTFNLSRRSYSSAQSQVQAHINKVRTSIIFPGKSEESSSIFRLFRSTLHSEFMCFIQYPPVHQLILGRETGRAYESVGQLSLSAFTTAANPWSAASDSIGFLLSISLTKIGM